MRDIKFEIAIVANEDSEHSSVKKGEKIVFENYVFNRENGLLFNDVGTFDFCLLYVRQYTGCSDVNKKEVYEYDIVKLEDGTLRVIAFLNGSFCVLREVSYNELQTSVLTEDDIEFLFDMEFEKMEVVGNIFDSPELLKAV